MEADTLISVHYERAGATIEKPPIRHQQADLGIFNARTFWHGIVMGFYYSYPYTFTCIIDRTPRWHMVICSTRLLQTQFRNGKITTPKLTWKPILLNAVCGLCPPHSVLCDASMMLGTFLRTRSRGLHCVRFVCEKCGDLSDRLSRWPSRLSVSPSFGHSSSTKRRWWQRFVLQLR